MLIFDCLLLVVDKSFSSCYLDPLSYPFQLSFPLISFDHLPCVTPTFSLCLSAPPLSFGHSDHQQTLYFFFAVKHRRSIDYLYISTFCPYSITYHNTVVSLFDKVLINPNIHFRVCLPPITKPRTSFTPVGRATPLCDSGRSRTHARQKRYTHVRVLESFASLRVASRSLIEKLKPLRLCNSSVRVSGTVIGS